MNGTQYEEFCRLFLSEKLGIPIEEMISCRMPSSIRPGLSEYKNQIDLYWEDGNELTRYVNIADAKWRGNSKNVPINKVRELQQVKDEIDAHKAMMITNSGFSRDAKKFAENHEIALHIVRPNFEYTTLHSKNRPTMQTQLQEYFNDTKVPYNHEIVHRAFDFGTDSTVHTSVPDKKDIQTRDIKQAPVNRMVETTSNRGTPPSIQKVQTRQGGSQTGGQGSSPSGRQGGPPSGRQGGSGPPKGPAKGGGGTSNRSR